MPMTITSFKEMKHGSVLMQIRAAEQILGKLSTLFLISSVQQMLREVFYTHTRS